MKSPLLVANWKMNGTADDLEEVRTVVRALDRQPPKANVAICPPATLLHRVASIVEGSAVAVGGQDCHVLAKGSFTGEVSAEMLADAGARLVILGHSERRQGRGESDAEVSDKMTAAARAGLRTILCIGETKAERDAGDAVGTVCAQLTAALRGDTAPADLVVAYEPVWAIGTGRTAGDSEIVEIHQAIRTALAARFKAAGRAIPILYGGSVGPDSAGAILRLPEVGGALVGGASLKASSFIQILRAA